MESFCLRRRRRRRRRTIAMRNIIIEAIYAIRCGVTYVIFTLFHLYGRVYLVFNRENIMNIYSRVLEMGVQYVL